MIQKILSQRGYRLGYMVVPDDGPNKGQVMVVPAALGHQMFPPKIEEPPKPKLKPVLEAFNYYGDVRCTECDRINQDAVMGHEVVKDINCIYCNYAFQVTPKKH